MNFVSHIWTFPNKAPLFVSTISLGTESRVSPKLVNNMSSGVPGPSLGHLFPKLEYWGPFEALAEKCENTIHISKNSLHGWRAWHNWFLDTKKFLVPGIFWSFFRYHGSKKYPEPKKSLT